MRKLILITFFNFIFFSLFSQKTEYKPVNYPKNYKAKLNAIYVKPKGWKGKVDLYYNLESKEPTPVVVNIHGGGWRKGQKEKQRGFGSFFKKGYAVANVAYRLSQQATAPAAIQDVRCVLIYLYKNAEKLNIDTNKIVIMGGSAGGHLALMAGLLANDKRFDSNCNFEGEIKVAAIIDKYGVSDLTPFKEWKSAKIWLGSKFGDVEFTKSVSPIYYVNAESPPVFIIHGDKDPIVPYSQSEKLYKKLVENNVKTEFMTVKGGLHGKFNYAQKNEFSERMWRFLEAVGL